MTKESSASSWYVSGPYGVRGPMDEVELRKHLQDTETLQVKQGFSTWYPANVIRAKLNKLDQEGIYVERSGTIEGPYTLPKAYDLLKSESDMTVRVKTTAKGEWVMLEHWVETIERMKQTRLSEEAE